MKLWDLIVQNQRFKIYFFSCAYIKVKYYWVFYINKKSFFFVYKLFNITKETLENNGIEVIADSVHVIWLNEKNIEEKLGHQNLPVISNKYNKIYKKADMN